MSTTDNEATRDAPQGQPAEQRLIGEARCIVRCRRRIERFVAFDAPILIDGETGTGKDLAARAIHGRSPRRQAPFVPVNCGALPDTLVENELFGHEAGAFTDARGKQSGLVTEAGSGTLFLDEIETLSPRAQAALLRFLENSEYRPLGGNVLRRSEARVIAATNVELPELVRRKQFRADLYYRLNILTLSMPPLRERREDVPLLANFFLRRLAKQYDMPVISLTAETLRWMVGYAWPGNVRELENLLHREYLLCDHAVLDIEDPAREPPREDAQPGISAAEWHDLSFSDAKSKLIERFERMYLDRLMLQTRGNVTRAAKIAGKERRALGKLIKKYAIDRRQYQ